MAQAQFYPANGAISATVHYDPQNPARAVLTIETPVAAITMFLFGGFGFFILGGRLLEISRWIVNALV